LELLDILHLIGSFPFLLILLFVRSLLVLLALSLLDEVVDHILLINSEFGVQLLLLRQVLSFCPLSWLFRLFLVHPALFACYGVVLFIWILNQLTDLLAFLRQHRVRLFEIFVLFCLPSTHLALIVRYRLIQVLTFIIDIIGVRRLLRLFPTFGLRDFVA